MPSRPIHGVVPVPDDALQPSSGEGVRHESEIRFGLATASREEEQVGQCAVLAALGVGRVGQRRDALQDERELERAPGPLLGHIGACHGLRQAPVGIRAPVLDGDAVHALTPHRLVREPERIESVRVGANELDPRCNRVGDAASSGDHLPRSLLVSFETGVGIADAAQLVAEPCAVALREGQQRCPQPLWLQL